MDRRVVLNESGEPWFAVEVAAVESPLRGGMRANLEGISEGISDVGSIIAKSCSDILHSLKAESEGALPDEVELTFGVSLGGEANIPLISKASGEATFSVRVCWHASSGQ